MSVDIHALSGAYAVDALDDFERVRFERHLDECAACRSEVDGLRLAASLMAETSYQDAPGALRERVLGGIATIRPLPPVIASADERVRSTRRRFPALVASAAALIVVGGVGATVWHPWSPDSQTDTVVADSPKVAQRVLDAPDAETFSQDTLDGKGVISVTRSGKLESAVVATEGLPALPDGQVYQLWLQHGLIMEPAGFLDDPETLAILHGDVDDAASSAITIEDAGGAKTPTYDRLVGTVPFESA